MDNKVTVLMAEYNTDEKKLRQAIESILNQTYKDFKFLIIDDCSNKRSGEIINSYKDRRIHLIRNEENLGLAKTLNKGISLIDTKYIIRMDTDDIAHKERIEKQVDFADNHPEYSIVSGRANIFDDKGIYDVSVKSGMIEKEDLIKGTPFIHPTMLIRKEDIKKIGGYPIYDRVEDYAMALEMYANGYKGYIMEDILIDYRMDIEGFAKKKLKYRFVSSKVRIKYYKKLKIPYFKRINIIRPILIGLIPKKIVIKYKTKKRDRFIVNTNEK